MIVTTDLDSFIGLLSQDVSPEEELRSGRTQVEGDQKAFQRFVGIFAWPVLEVPAPA